MDSGLLKEKPNVIWTGEGEPPSAVNVGNTFIGPLPEGAKQRKGFTVTSEECALLCATFNGYKVFVGKGGE